MSMLKKTSLLAAVLMAGELAGSGVRGVPRTRDDRIDFSGLNHRSQGDAEPTALVSSAV